jgi:hypothetical protein
MLLIKMRVIWVIAVVTGVVYAAAPPTFYRDVLPVLERNCQSCHRAGEAAPMPLVTYQDARPWAKAIRQAVLTKKMPPWLADPSVGHFTNDRTLPPADIETLVKWSDASAPEGSPKDAPKRVGFTEGWNIGKPDVILEMPAAYEVPATGTIEYQHFVVPTGFTEDKWVQVVELRPGNRAVVHHAAVFVRPPESKWMRNAKLGEPVGRQAESGISVYEEILDFHVPGAVPHALPEGQAKLVKAGSDLVFQMHYTSNGKPATDRTRIGIVFAKEPPRERIFTLQIANRGFAIPAGASDFPVEAKLTLQGDARIVALNPHMHVRGKSFEFRVTTGAQTEPRVLLRVPRYDFSWQLQYYLAEPLEVSRGSLIECFATFDNSLNNPANPDPSKEVRWGDQSWEEMMVGTVDVAIDAHMDPMDLYRPARKRSE